MRMDRKNINIQTGSEQETVDFANGLARSLRSGDVVLLYGDLGMGKSVVSRTIIRALCKSSAMEVPSPTFTLVQTYDTPSDLIWHFDLYRLADTSEIYELGWEEALSGGIVLVEWPERLGGMHPKSHIDIILNTVEGQPDARTIEVKYAD